MICDGLAGSNIRTSQSCWLRKAVLCDQQPAPHDSNLQVDREWNPDVIAGTLILTFTLLCSSKTFHGTHFALRAAGVSAPACPSALRCSMIVPVHAAACIACLGSAEAATSLHRLALTSRVFPQHHACPDHKRHCQPRTQCAPKQGISSMLPISRDAPSSVMLVMD